MIIQKSYLNNNASLYLIATPIGNFDDMTFRSIEILNSVDSIFCEDTRVTKILLSHFNIKTPLFSYHIFNEEKVAFEIIELLKQNKKIALVSDAGLPCISDPGFLVSREAIKNNFNVISLPGASAGITALVGSGLPNDKFFFYGFLSSKQSQRIKQLEELKDYSETIIFYEAPHRIKESLVDLYNVFKNRNIVIARELTKKYEEYTRGTLEEIMNSNLELKGEIVLLVEGVSKTMEIQSLNEEDIFKHYQFYLDKGIEEKEAMKKVASDRNISKSEVYKQVKI